MFENKKYLPYLIILFILLIILYFNIDKISTAAKDETEFVSTTDKEFGSTTDKEFGSTTDKEFGSTFSKGGKGGKGGKEGFISINWSPLTIKNFLNFEQTMNPNLIFDVDAIQQQASEDEVKTLIKTGKWPWSDETKKLYMDVVKTNTMIKTSPKAAMEQAQTIYNETIIREMISWSAPEGQFLLRGAYSIEQNQNQNQNNSSGSFGIDSGLITESNNLIRCGIDSNNKVSLQETQNLGDDGITGAHIKKTTTLDYKKLPSLIPGFRFIGSPCDPCTAVENPPKYTCPFSLTSYDPSPIWASLWELTAKSTNKNKNKNAHIHGDKTQFPLLLELKSELNAAFPETGVKPKPKTKATPTPASTPTPTPTTSATTTKSTPATTESVSSENQQKINSAISKLTMSLSTILNKPEVSNVISSSINSLTNLIESK